MNRYEQDKIKMLLPLSLMIGGFSAQSLCNLFQLDFFSCCMPTQEIRQKEDNKLSPDNNLGNIETKFIPYEKESEKQEEEEEPEIWVEVSEEEVRIQEGLQGNTKSKPFGENYSKNAPMLFGNTERNTGRLYMEGL